MDSNLLLAIAGIILSLVFRYFPKLNLKWEALDEATKSLIMLGLVLLVAVVAFGLSCTPLAADFNIPVTCDKAGALGLLQAFIVVLIGNQVTAVIAPKTRAAREIRDAKE